MSKPKRTFSADVGQYSTGTAGPDQIEFDLDNIFAMFDPYAMTRNGSPGGIGADNLQIGAATDSVIGDRTVMDTAAPAGNTGTLTDILGWLANRLRAITGKADWKQSPALTIEQISQTVTISGLAADKATDTVIGNRTINQTEAPTSDTGTLSQLLGRLANRIRAIMGTSDWKSAPATDLVAIRAHMDNAALHQAGHTHNGLNAAGVDVQIQAGTGIAVSASGGAPNPVIIQISATGGAAPGPHKETHYKHGVDPLVANDIGALSKDADDQTSGDLGLAKNAEGSNISPAFAGANTKKSRLHFTPPAGSSLLAYLLRELSTVAGYDNKLVLHVVLGSANSDDLYLTIHGEGQTEAIRLHTSGKAYFAGNVEAAGAMINGTLDVNTPNGRAIAPVGADKWAT